MVGLTAAVYAPVRHYPFYNIDDPAYVTGNPQVTAGLTIRGVIWAFTALLGPGWHPLAALSHMLDCQVYGLNAGGHHLTNVLLHIANTLLLLIVLTQMTGKFWRSAFVAAVFALHPCQVEVVAWVSERKGVLSTFFLLLTLWSYYRFTQQRSLRRYVWVLLAFTSGLMVKPILMTLPFVLLLLDFWPLRRLALGGPRSVVTARTTAGPQPVGGLFLEKVPLLVVAGVLGLVTLVTEGRTGIDYPLSFRIANALVAYVTYIATAIWPLHLAVFYPRSALATWQVAAAALILSGVSLYVVRKARRYPYLLVGWLWFLIILAPVIGIVAPGMHLVADRFTYVPLIGLAIIAAWGIPDLLERWRHRNAACAAAAILAVSACAVLTSKQVEFWRDNTSLYEHALKVTRDNYFAHFIMGWSLFEEGRFDEALPHLAETLRIQPDHVQANYYMGRLLLRRGDLDAARHYYTTALQADPTYAEAHVGLGLVSAAQGDIAGAVAHYREAIRQNPDLPGAHTNLAIALENMGQRDEAIVEYREGVRLEPQRAESRCNLAAALAADGRLPEAIEQFRVAERLAPQLVDARIGLAKAYASAGQTREAIREFDDVLRDRPGSTPAEVSLAWLLATTEDPHLRDGPRAVELAERASARTERRDAEALNSLAAAYAAVGRFADAVDTATQALAVAHAGGPTPLETTLAARLEQYRHGRPVYQRPTTPAPATDRASAGHP